MYKYNRIIIVGNGLDIALGLKTHYKDFLLSLLKKYLLASLNGKVNTPLIDLNWSITSNEKNFKNGLNEIQDLDVLLSRFKMYNIRGGEGFKGFLKSLIDERKILGSWVDLEEFYYKELVDISRRKNCKDEILELNESFQELIKELELYLNEEEQKLILDSNNSALNLFIESLTTRNKNDLLLLYHKDAEDFFDIEDPKNICFLDFNYTNTLSQLVDNYYQKNNIEINKIHGSVLDKNNPVIFGYGDDYHDDYRVIQETKIEEAYNYIKPFKYSLNRNYVNLLNVMNSNKFEVYILGHSCGLSDRTLLKTIFEHANCLNLKIYHRGDNSSFTRREIAIDMLIDNKQKRRNMILPFFRGDFIPTMG